MICSRCRMLTVISYTFMYTLNVSFKMSWYRCSILTFVIIISNSIVFTRHCTCILREPTVAAVYLHWLQEYLTPSCLRSMCLLRSLSWVAAYLYLSGISYAFMLALNMFSQITSCSRSVFTLITWIPWFFVFTFNMTL